jgi:hypothetical protein
VTSVKAHLTIAAMAIALGALSAPANATISTPFGSINAGGFGVGGQQQDFSVRTPWGGVSMPGFGLGPPWGGGPWLGLGNGGPGASGNYTGFGVSTPWGGFSGPGFGIGFGPFGASFGGFGLGGPGYPPGVVPFFGLNGGAPNGANINRAELGVSTPFGGFYGPGFGVNFGPFGGNFGGFGMGPQQALSVSTPFGGFSGPGFGVSTPWGGFSGPGFGISTPWGGVSTPIFGLNGQPNAAAPQFIPVMVPYPVPMQGQMGPAQGGAQPTQCMINAVPALTKSVDDCEKAGGAVPPQRTSAVQEAKKE